MVELLLSDWQAAFSPVQSEVACIIIVTTRNALLDPHETHENDNISVYELSGKRSKQ